MGASDDEICITNYIYILAAILCLLFPVFVFTILWENGCSHRHETFWIWALGVGAYH